ncbi:hypothetical protein TVAG_189970 [Trichomonas vaginalis G3]|uniref:Uncharacterized protein n=1 Tax=Trichomonas vaginalis (strain ATCC PRA-98 / G3) TaxID=412133 RepID=A2DKC9_TRIV3|nr:hypothetical protein TVAGG3_0996180 [Trichomonas vaginalis G3]EAY19106.1 hypothetical protein TVAG_189970 [Trichomonas vaginalis G3]KAI5490404.1 hypothetical protein TVAGG3_0996180 [Trichomonas vaginalis G3]|eukprot:XP_001580092.1 hypothetical protein [Trichomonas vaginalis G3]
MSIAYVDIGNHTTKIYCDQKEISERTIVCIHSDVIECGNMAVRVTSPYEDTTFRDIISHLATLEKYKVSQNNEYDPRLIFAHFLKFIMTSTKATELVLIKHNWWTNDFENTVKQSAEFAEIKSLKFVEAYQALSGYAHAYLPNDKHEKYVIFDFGASVTEGYVFEKKDNQISLAKYGSCNIGGDKLTTTLANYALSKIFEKDDEKVKEYKGKIPDDKRLQSIIYEAADKCKQSIIPNLQVKFEAIAITDAPFDCILESNDFINKCQKYVDQLSTFIKDFVKEYIEDLNNYDKDKIELEWIGSNSFSQIAKNIFTPQYELFKPNFSYSIGAQTFLTEKIDLAIPENINPTKQSFPEDDDANNVIKQKKVSLKIISNEENLDQIRDKYKELEHKYQEQLIEDNSLNDLAMVEDYINNDFKELEDKYNEIQNDGYLEKLDKMLPLIRNYILKSNGIDYEENISNKRNYLHEEETIKKYQDLLKKITDFMESSEYRSIKRKTSFLNEDHFTGSIKNILDQYRLKKIESYLHNSKYDDAKQLAEKIYSRDYYQKYILPKIEKMENEKSTKTGEDAENQQGENAKTGENAENQQEENAKSDEKVEESAATPALAN